MVHGPWYFSKTSYLKAQHASDLSGLSAKEFVGTLSTSNKIVQRLKAVFFVYGEINLSVVGVLMKFYTKSRNYLNEWHGIKAIERERTIKNRERLLAAHQYCRKGCGMIRNQPLWKTSDQSGITLPSWGQLSVTPKDLSSLFSRMEWLMLSKAVERSRLMRMVIRPRSTTSNI